MLQEPVLRVQGLWGRVLPVRYLPEWLPLEAWLQGLGRLEQRVRVLLGPEHLGLEQ